MFLFNRIAFNVTMSERCSLMCCDRVENGRPTKPQQLQTSIRERSKQESSGIVFRGKHTIWFGRK